MLFKFLRLAQNSKNSGARRACATVLWVYI